MKILLFATSFVFFCNMSLAAEVASLRGPADIPVGSNPAVGIDWQPEPTSIARTFIHQPPLIPHAVEGYETSASVNDCLSCHSEKAPGASILHKIVLSVDGDNGLVQQNNCKSCHTGKKPVAAKPYKTHYTGRDGEITNTISSRWYFCTQCHVGQVDAPPLVENTF
ncbi:MAG: hypothetical protein D3923_09315 [Candidatus Electrothrix sp. AR3]|nr:hypothetical protein [Candidatus Electrothrix sp. AR3]